MDSEGVAGDAADSSAEGDRREDVPLPAAAWRQPELEDVAPGMGVLAARIEVRIDRQLIWFLGAPVDRAVWGG
jgi:hypothetical protein